MRCRQLAARPRAALLALVVLATPCALVAWAPAAGATTTTGALTTTPAAIPTTGSTTGPGGAVTTGSPGATGSTITSVLRPSGARAQAKGSSGVSGGAIAAAVIAALIALACLVWAVFRWGAFEPHWLLSSRHSLAEAGFRASATWAEFKDWARLGH